MGFLDNVGNSFGKKTGKALGNALYGKHADDKRIGFRDDTNRSQYVNQTGVDYVAIEKEKRKTLAYEQNSKLLDSIISIEFSTDNKNAVIKELTTLSTCVDLWLKESNKNISMAKSKFDTGLAILSTIDPKSPMIDYFTNKKSDWTVFEEKRRKRIFWLAGSAIIIIALCFILAKCL
ncbi:MAG: hypothetical protein LBT43_04345 [Prevotella sp.]|jgi:hypothetical protein|nr:hypothetical protein [Prevotella sp.]